MNFNDNNFEPQFGPQVQAEPLSTYTAKTFGWMFLGLLTTFFIAMAGYITGAVGFFFASPYILIAIAGLELGLVFYLSARITKLSVVSARTLFFVYAMLNGVTFSSLFILYDLTSLVFVFALTALYFGAMAAYGYFTKADLSRIAPVLTFGLIFLILYSIVAIFINIPAMDIGMSIVAIVIFLGLTAYDTQKIKAYHSVFSADPEQLKKASIFGALQLYLDFINLFLYLIRILAKRR